MIIVIGGRVAGLGAVGIHGGTARRATPRIPDYYKFNPYNLLPYGWLRRLLKASHPHARADYYVYALRHILR